ncbi:MAG TPA: hypothetical protein VFA21_20385 [Pyrinomonadaceae bacterium]|nr:hypothetical protein [Pyrinomonadaceae bacterium]
MKTLIIKTSRALNGFAAWPDGDPFNRATSLDSEQRAAQKLAVRIFVGHTRTAQMDEDVLSRIAVKRLPSGSFIATFDEPKGCAN